MENLEDTDNITKNIVQEIVRECKKLKSEANENFCVYYVKLLTLDPMWKISPEKKLNRENIQNIVTYIINKLQNQDCFDLVTMKIQHTFLSHIISRDFMISNHLHNIEKVLHPLLDDIISFNVDEQNKFFENKLYRKLAFYITLITGLGNPKHPAVIKEVTFALRSVLDEDEILKFAQSKTEEKLADIIQYKKLVAGIRLFNRDCGRPAAEIDDLPKILSHSVLVVTSELQNELVLVMEEVNLATSAIDNVYKLVTFKEIKTIQQNNEIHRLLYELVPKYSDIVTNEDIQYTRDLLILARQREVYIRMLLKKVNEVDENVKSLLTDLQELLAKIHNVVKFKVAVSTNVVYPLFLELSETWNKIQIETFVLSTYTQIFQKIRSLTSTMEHDTKKMMKMIGNNEILTDAIRLEQTMNSKIKQKNNKCQIVDFSCIVDFESLEYLGFCVWSLVQTKGGLIPGNPNMGVCKWKKKYYAFANTSAAEAFGMEPDWIIMQAITIVRNQPELINLLELHDDVTALKNVKVLYEAPVEMRIPSNSEVQTELHPIPYKIDPDYVWNMWDYYRQAIKLANISQCKTRSSQTKKSHFRGPIFTQTTDPRDKICQTKKDNYINTSKPSNFIFGLRGRKDDIQHVVELTRPFDEEKFYTCANANEMAPIYKIKPRKCQTWKTKEKYENSKSVSKINLQEPLVEEEEMSFKECICIIGLQQKMK